MDTLIRNIDDWIFRAARALAALESRTVGEVVTDALREYLRKNAAANEALAASSPEQPLLERPGPDAQEGSIDAEHPATHVDEVVFLYCI